MGLPENKSMSSKTPKYVIRSIKTVARWDWTKKAMHKCVVCNLVIKPGQLKVQCPFCKKFAHQDHLFEWLKSRGTCPYCKKRLDRRNVNKIISG